VKIDFFSQLPEILYREEKKNNKKIEGSLLNFKGFMGSLVSSEILRLFRQLDLIPIGYTSKLIFKNYLSHFGCIK
jgi:hypothetical protein